MEPTEDKENNFPDQIPVQKWDEAINPEEGVVSYNKGLSVVGKPLRSTNFTSGDKGWQIDSNGNVEFNDGTFRGDVNLGGTNITVNSASEIQDAIDEVETEGGGTVYLQPGTYTLTADISIPGGVTLQGVSRDGVILDCDGTYKVQITGTNIYSTGTLAISDTQTTVVGTGTTFTAAMVGRYIFLSGTWHEITVFTDTTHVTIGTAYSGTNLSGYPVAIADTNFNATIGKLTIIGATAAGLSVQYASEPVLNDIVVDACGTGIDMDFASFPIIVAISAGNGVNLNMNYTIGFYIDFCDFSFSTTGAGVIMTKSGNATFFNTSIDNNTGNGITATDCDTIYFASLSNRHNGGKGTELVSGNTDNQFFGVMFIDNASDGLKLTATSDRNQIVGCTIADNAGYGVNIAASTCDNNQVIAPAFDNNTSGSINNLGTGTSILPEGTPVALTDGATVNLNASLSDTFILVAGGSRTLAAPTLPTSGKTIRIQHIAAVAGAFPDKSLDLEAGSTQYASIADASQTGLDITGDLTIEAWVKVESFTSSPAIVTKWLSTGNQRSYGWRLRTDGDAEFFITTGGDSGTYTEAVFTDLNITTGIWYHLAVAYDASAGSVELFKNGVSVQTVNGLGTSIHSGTAPFAIGVLDPTGTPANHGDGLYSLVRVWDVLRTETQIADNMFSVLGATTNLQGEWTLNDVYTDNSGNSNTLTATGSPVFVSRAPGFTLTLNQGAGGFRFGTSITEITMTENNTTDYILASYNATDNKWDVTDYKKGY